MQIYYATVHYDEKWAPEQDSIDEPRAEEQREHGGHLRKEKLQKQKNKTARPKTPKKTHPPALACGQQIFLPGLSTKICALEV